MYTVEDIYIAFRRAQAKILNRPYRLPKDFGEYLVTKMTESNRTSLENVTKAFNTRWQNIDPDTYFQRGFELFKTFSYNMFFNPKVIMFYIEKDKNMKRETGQLKRNIVNSVKFVREWIKEKNIREDISLASQYCAMSIDGVKAPVKHYVLGKVDKHFIVWLINRKVLNPTSNEEGLMPLICENYRVYLDDINNINSFLKEINGRF